MLKWSQIGFVNMTVSCVVTSRPVLLWATANGVPEALRQTHNAPEDYENSSTDKTKLS